MRLEHALEAAPRDGDITLLGPDGEIAALSVDDARATARNLVAAANAVEGRGGEGESYQKPLG
jgi:hypothetical protein